MKTIVSILFIILVGLSLVTGQTSTVKAKDSSVTNLSPFQYQYYANGTLTNFDIQNVQSQGDFFISMVVNNQIYYNNFSFYDSASQGYQLTNNDFNILHVNSTNINSSTSITASQYFFTSKMTVFLIYFTYNGANYLYIFVYDTFVKSLLQSQLVPNISYFKTNKIVKFANSNDIFIELQTADSFELLQVSSSNYTITQVFDGKNILFSSNSFAVQDPQFSNDVLYVLSSGQTQDIFSINSSVTALSFNGSTILYKNYFFNTYISSISIVNNLLFAYSQNNNIVHVIDLGTYQEKYTINNLIVDNFTFIRAFNDNSFVLRDFQDNLYYCHAQQQGNTYSMVENGTVFSLYNSNPTVAQSFDPTQKNNEYTLVLVGEYNYLLAGYLFTNGIKTGYGIVFHSMNNAPGLFIDMAKTVTFSTFSSATTVSSSISSNFNVLPLIAFFIVILVFLVAVFIFASKKKQESVEPSKKYKVEHSASYPKSSIPKTKLCNSCGEKVTESDMFCQNCGNRI